MAFSSSASNLVAGDTNPIEDVFVRNLLTGTIRLVSATSSGASGNNRSYNPVISADGRYVAFTSGDNNLAAGDTNASEDVFVRDLVTGTTRLVSSTSIGVSGNNASYSPVIGADARYVAFHSRASNLVAGDANGTEDVFVRNLVMATTRLVSATGSGVSGDNFSSNPVIAPMAGMWPSIATPATWWLATPIGQRTCFCQPRPGHDTSRQWHKQRSNRQRLIAQCRHQRRWEAYRLPEQCQ